MPFESANCYGYAWNVNLNFDPGSIAMSKDVRAGVEIDHDGTLESAKAKVMEACRRDGLTDVAGALSYPIAIFINKYAEHYDFHFYRYGPNKWSHKMGSNPDVEIVEDIEDPVAYNLLLVNTLDPNEDLITGQLYCGVLYRPNDRTDQQISNAVDDLD
ncbi:hypothetical protein [Pseudomonas gingeri]|uniref:hypothetical protein n=1 Tax=Pseudomonas gingeri TaxID=117681 RepID=UPI0015BDEB80|nr:hypothetical protein [Pseudomonas gingeri]NWD51363.1 hypothetical protein [Pseudomonas gingeri]